MYKFDLTQKQVQKLYDYLGRVQLKGPEAVEYVAILNTITKQYKEQQKDN